MRHSMLRHLVAGVLGLALVSSPTAIVSRTAVAVAASTKSAAPEVKGISRYSEIEPGLARGGQPSREALQWLHDQGYRTVVSFRKNDDERRELERLGIKYVEIPLNAGPFSATPPSDDDLQRFFTTVTDSTLRPVFIHCRAGRDRTGAMTALYRIQACGWTNDDAVKEMKEHGFRGHYKRLMRFVREYVPRESFANAAP